MWETIRAKAYEALRSTSGNRMPPIRWTRGVLTFVNDMLGRPLAPEDEIRERREYERRRRQRLAEAMARRKAAATNGTAAGSNGLNGANGKVAALEAAPVVVYVDGRSHRELQRIETVFKGREIPFTKLDVEGDDATRSWVRTTSKRDDFPVVFIAGQPIGAYDELVQLDATSQLTKLVWGRSQEIRFSPTDRLPDPTLPPASSFP